MEKGTGPR